MITKKRKFAPCILVCLFLFLLSSCKSSSLLGPWEFIDVYEGKLTKIDTLQSKKNNSKYGTGVLEFNKDNSFTSLGNKGKYSKDDQKLKMKYDDGQDTVVMNISYLSKNYLLLSNGNSPKTWFYRKK
ncbi:lipocalin family protein [Chryseobacterium elymi]|uniref:lipocalin family protein n=1 Tax=Chryseobacterium elymi TaxID=395936 RepID=UPI0013001A48|nr:lipocalin family protein [Chryseobacterium elymi]